MWSRALTRAFLALAAFSAATAPVAAQIEIAPRIAAVTGDGWGSDFSYLAGVRGRKAGAGLTPFASAYVRTTGVSWSEGPRPSGTGLQTVLGGMIEGGEPGSLRAFASAGAGVVFWRNDAWGEQFIGELEAGLTAPTSESFGIQFGLRVERLEEEGTWWGGTLGVVWLIGG